MASNLGFDLVALLVACVILIIHPGSSAKSLISGDLTECSNEGERVAVDIVAKNPCYSCFCRDGRVECDSQQCPSLAGCHAILFTRRQDVCCDQCKGCLSNGTLIPHGHAWPSLDDPCRVRMCQAGVLTTSRQSCRPPCSNPVAIPGQCCPVCSGCTYKGVEYMDGEGFHLQNQPGVKCTCKGGNISCVHRPCPVLNCPQESTYQVKGDICPRCKGKRVVFSLYKSCYFAKKVYNDGDVVVLDECTSCVCQEGTMQCERTHCPSSPECPAHQRKLVAGECCHRCEGRTKTCVAGNVTRQEGQVWEDVTGCRTCRCVEGQTKCQPRQCAAVKRCARHETNSSKTNNCCPTCVEERPSTERPSTEKPSTVRPSCSVRGRNFDSFKTFDGLAFKLKNSLKGSCLYELATDCLNGRFKIRVRYAKTPPGKVRKNGRASSRGIDLVVMTLGGTKVKLHRDLTIRANHSRRLSSLSSRQSGQSLDITVRPPVISVRDKSIGVKVTWNVLKRLSVRLPGRGGRLCGLCGNLNGDRDDDFVTPQGRRADTSTQLAKSWKRGKSCRKKGNEVAFGSKTVKRKTEIDESNSGIVESGYSQHRLRHHLTRRNKDVLTHDEDIFKRNKSHSISPNNSDMIMGPDSSKSHVLKNIQSRHDSKVRVRMGKQHSLSETSLSESSESILQIIVPDRHSSVPEVDPSLPRTNVSTEHQTKTPSSSDGSKSNPLQATNNESSLKSLLGANAFSQLEFGPAASETGQSDLEKTKMTLDVDQVRPTVASRCQPNSLAWGAARDTCVRVRNWMFFTCAGSINVGQMTSQCVDDVCACQAKSACIKTVVSKHIGSCVRLVIESKRQTSSSASSSPPSIPLESSPSSPLSASLSGSLSKQIPSFSATSASLSATAASSSLELFPTSANASDLQLSHRKKIEAHSPKTH